MAIGNLCEIMLEEEEGPVLYIIISMIRSLDFI